MHVIKCECYGSFEFVNGHGIAGKKCFRLIKNVGVNRAPIRIRLSGRVGDSGRDTFENEKFNKTKQMF